MRTIEQLNTLLEELEKRIRTISTAQKTLNQINEILAYIQSVQDYLQELQTTFDNHVQECDDYSTDISNLQTQIDTINQTINNLSTDNETTNQLKTSLSELQTKVDEFIGNSSTTAESLENDISTLQTDLGSCQDDITDIESEISAINSSIGEQNTTITNLQTTQTNLQTTQSSQASTINNINSRLTTAENNISTLTGGVDVSEIDNRITVLEHNFGASALYKCESDLSLNNNSKLFNSKIFHFNCSTDAEIFITANLKFKVNATISSTSDFNLVINSNTIFTKKFKITEDMTSYSLKCMYKPEYVSNALKVYILTTADITFDEVELTIYGQNVKLRDYQQEISVHCFNGEIYLTRHYENYIKYGKFLPTDTINLNSLPTKRLANNDDGSFTWQCFMPYVKASTVDGVTKFIDYTDAIGGVDTRGYNSVINLLDNEITISEDIKKALSLNNVEPIIGHFFQHFVLSIYNDRPGALPLYSGYTYYFMPDSYALGKYTYISPARDNYRCIGDESLKPWKVSYVCQLNDGYICFVVGLNANVKQAKICKGEKATAYKQTDGSYNVYITVGNNTLVYNLIFTESTGQFDFSLVKTIENCICVYEILGNKILKCDKSKTWSIEEISEE